MSNPHIGSSLDDVLAEIGALEEVTARAMKRAIARQIEVLMVDLGFTKTKLARLMRTSRAALDRLLDPNETSLTLTTLAAAGAALQTRVLIALVREPAPADNVVTEITVAKLAQAPGGGSHRFSIKQNSTVGLAHATP